MDPSDIQFILYGNKTDKDYASTEAMSHDTRIKHFLDNARNEALLVDEIRKVYPNLSFMMTNLMKSAPMIMPIPMTSATKFANLMPE